MFALKIISAIMLIFMILVSASIMEDQEDDGKTLPISEIIFLLNLFIPLLYIVLN